MGLFSKTFSYLQGGEGMRDDRYVSPLLWSPFADTNPVPELDDSFSDYDASALTGRYANLVYSFMARDDSQVASDLLLLRSPMLSTVFTVEGGSDRARAFCADQVALPTADMPNPNVDFKKFLREVFTCMEHGFSVHEIYYDYMGGRDTIGGIEFRWQNSIESFKSHRGRLTHVVQMIERKGQQPEEITLPRKNLVYFAPYSIGDNWRGRSLLRPAYKPWFGKNQLYYADLLGTRRRLMPLPVGYYSQDVTKAEQQRYEKLLSNMTSHLQSYLLLPKDDMEVSYLSSKLESDTIDPTTRFKFYNMEISRALFAHVLALSESNMSDRSLSNDLYDLLFNVLASLLDDATETITADVFKPLVEMNFPGDMVPRLRWSGLDTKRILRIVEKITSLGMGDFIRPDDKLEDFLRENMELPEKDTATVREKMSTAGNANNQTETD